MTKKQQNRSHGFGSRTLSVLLAALIILSTLVVMMTATMITADAAISYWYVSGNLGSGWKDYSSYQMNNGNGWSTTIPVEGNATGIQFKVKAYENNSAVWNGGTGTTITDGGTVQLSWNGGSDISFNPLPANTESVTFTITTSGMTNYVKVKANVKSGGDPTPGGETGAGEYIAKVNTANSANDTVTWVDATYYDYLSDAELSNGWLYPAHVGTNGFNGCTDEWYPFYNFNRNVVKSLADSNSAWSKPLYFGNFCNTYNAYSENHSHHPGVTNGYTDATSSYNVTRFNYPANNSNGVYDMYTSVQGLMGSTLSNGKLQTADGMIAPYFDQDTLGSSAKIVKSAFPFRKSEKVTDGGTPYTRYEFDSTNAKDNVYFTWKTEGGATYPESVNYGAGTSYGVKDGIKDFMNTASGYGIFPFNNASNNYKGTKTKTNENLNYGFGIRMDMKFRVPDNAEVKFDFSGDDDLWMYITDESDGSTQLVLDMGGSHKMSEGVVDFNTKTATVYKVDNPSASNKDIWVQEESGWGSVVIRAWDDSGNAYWYYPTSAGNVYRFHDNLHGYNDSGNYVANSKTLGEMPHFLIAKDTNYTGKSGDLNTADYQGKCTYTNNFSSKTTNHVETGHCYEATKSFNFDPSHTYTMTIFYMERGLIESNCKMGFTITPLGNNFIVTEQIDPANVNTGLRQKVLDVTQFGFKVRDNQTQVGQGYGNFTLGNGGIWDIPDKVSVGGSEVDVLGINSHPWVEQYALTDSYLEYDALWYYRDNVNDKSLDDNASNIGVTKPGSSTSTSQQTLIDSVTQNTYDYAELQVDYINTPRVTNVSVTKQVNDPGVDHSSESFPATVKMQLKSGEEFAVYNLETSDGTATNGRVTLRPGRTITIPNVPIGTRVIVEEDSDPNYTSAANSLIVGQDGSNTITVVNTPVNAEKITGQVTGTKTFDGQAYNGNLFRFRLEGVARMSGDAANVIDTSSVRSDTATGKYMTDTVTNGSFTIGGLEFAEPGVYRYHVYEDMSKLSVTDGTAGTHYASDISKSGTDYLVKFTVEKRTVSGKPTLIASDPVYIPYSEWDDDAHTVPHTMVPADFNKAPATSMTFTNTAQKGSVRVEKSDQTGDPVEGVTFAVYALDDETYEALIALDEDMQYELLRAMPSTKTGITVKGTAYDDHDQPYETGIAQIGDLDIYQSGYKTSSTPKYQQYVMIELSGPANYNINKTIHSFKFPMNGDDGLQYHCTYKYINGYLRAPSTAGTGMTLFKIIGWCVAGMSLIALSIYLVYTKKYAKRKTAKHFMK